MEDLKGLKTWHKFITDRDSDTLDNFIAEDAKLYSPVVFKPVEGKFMVSMYLKAASKIIANDKFRYVNEVVNSKNAILEFETEINGIWVNGVDMLEFTKEGLLKEIKVMIRPLKGIQIVHQKMGEYLEKLKG